MTMEKHKMDGTTYAGWKHKNVLFVKINLKSSWLYKLKIDLFNSYFKALWTK